MARDDPVRHCGRCGQRNNRAVGDHGGPGRDEARHVVMPAIAVPFVFGVRWGLFHVHRSIVTMVVVLVGSDRH